MQWFFPITWTRKLRHRETKTSSAAETQAGQSGHKPGLLTTTCSIPGSVPNVCQILSTLQLRNLSLRAVEQQLKVTQLGSNRVEVHSQSVSRASALPHPPPQSCQILRRPKQVYPVSLHCSVYFSKSAPPLWASVSPSREGLGLGPADL